MSAPAAVSVAAMPFQLVPASRFTIEQLTAAYNRTRVDYLVPMPMNTARLAEYIQHYDVDLERSVVAFADEQMLGLGMLGVRPGRTWITRLGVLPGERRQGVGWVLAQALLAASEGLGAPRIILEVIKNNTPAYNLFLKSRFEVAGELVVLRRPPGPPPRAPVGEVRWLARADSLGCLAARPGPQAWLMETESLAHLEHLTGIHLVLPDGSRGWLVWQVQMFRGFPLLLSHLTLHAERGNPVEVGRALLAHLYQQYPDLDTHTENIRASDPHLPALIDMGFVESFRRLEMHRLNRRGVDPA
jgi:ribosomal protein S18 acetylase RimI-like enzyme